MPALSGIVGETRDIWNRKAAFWDEYMGDGVEEPNFAPAPSGSSPLSWSSLSDIPPVLAVRFRISA